MRTPITTLSAALSVLFLPVSHLHAAATDLDASFNGSGYTASYLDLGSSKADILADTALSASTGAIYSAGKVEYVSAGGQTFGVLFKHMPNGSADTSFQNGSSIGRVQFPAERTGGSSGLTGVAFIGVNTGAVAVVGFNDLNNGQRCGVAYHVLDNSVVKGALLGNFGGSGQSRFAFCSGVGAEMTFSDVKILPDGRWLISGNSSYANGEKYGFLLRLTTNGQLDASFNAGGISGAPGFVNFDIRTGKDDSALHLAVDSTGYYVAGNSVFAKASSNLGFSDDVDLWIAKVTTSGSFDTRFNTNGKRIFALDLLGSDKTDLLADLAVDSAGKPVLLGNINPQHVIYNQSGAIDPARFDKSRQWLLRLNANGQLDTSFNGNGQVVFSQPAWSCGNADYCSHNEPAALALTPSNEIWVAGRFVPEGFFGTPIANAKLALTRFTSSGVKTIEMQRPVGQSNVGVSLLRQSDGRLIVGQQLRTTTLQTDLDFSLMRLLGTP